MPPIRKKAIYRALKSGNRLFAIMSYESASKADPKMYRRIMPDRNCANDKIYYLWEDPFRFCLFIETSHDTNRMEHQRSP